MESQPTTETDGDSWTIQARVMLRESYRPWWGCLLAPVIGAIKWIPSYKDTKKGRNNALQIRGGILAVGIAGLVFGKELVWILAGAAVMLLAFVAPMSEVKKRTRLGRLGRLRGTSKRDRPTPGRLTYDGRRIALEIDGERVRRVLIDRDEHRIDISRFDDAPCLAVGPSGGKKSETIWICARSGDSLPDIAAAESVARSDMDAPALVAADDWRRIRRSLDSHE